MESSSIGRAIAFEAIRCWFKSSLSCLENIMTIQIINEEPDPSVIKEVICKMCGVKLSYVPIDVKTVKSSSYDGSSDIYKYIECPKCKNMIYLK